MEEQKEEVKDEKKNEFICCLCCMIKKCIVFFVPGFVAALILFVIINAALVPTSKAEFCGELCHEMDEVYASWQASTHAKNSTGIVVECIECHLPPKDKFFTHLTAKAYTGTKDAYHTIVGTEYDTEAIREKVREHMTNDVCLRCHENLKDAIGDEIAADLHKEMVFEVPEGEEVAKCIECHADAGHVRDDE
jgi:cytochrome c nitrite reductase small subunit